MFVVLERFVCAHTLPVVLWELKLNFFNAWEVAAHQFLGLCGAIQLLPILYDVLEMSVYFSSAFSQIK